MRDTVRKPFRSFAAGLVLIVSTLVTFSDVASAAACVIDPEYSSGPVITTDPSGTVSPGEQIEIIGTGFPPNCEIQIIIDNTVVGTVTTTPEGTFSFPYTVPTNFVGSLTIVITAGEYSQTITLQVATPTTTTQPPLEPTGSDSATLASVGLVLIAGGGLLVLFTRKRREEMAV